MDDERVRPCCPGAVGHRDAHAVEAERRIDMRGGDRSRLARGGTGARGAVAPADRVRPGSVVRVGIAERDRELDRVARVCRDVGAGAHHRPGGVTAGGARIAERLAGDGHELPRIARGVEGELQDAPGRAVSHLTVRTGVVGVDVLRAARADDELPDPLHWIGDARRRLACEPLVKGVMRVHHDVDPRAVQHVPQRPDRRVGVVLRVEQRMVPVGERTTRGVGGEIGAQPLHLGRRGGGRDQAGAAAIQDDDVPGAEVVAVVALLRVPGRAAEVAEVPGGVRRLVVAVAGRRLGARLVLSPARVVAGVVLRQRAVVVGGVAGREHRARDAADERRRGVVAGRLALRDVAGTD